MIASPSKDAFKFVGEIFTAVGIVLLAVGAWVGHRQYTILKSWPSVEAEVTKSQVTQHQSQNPNHPGTTMPYKAELEFRWTQFVKLGRMIPGILSGRGAAW